MVWGTMSSGQSRNTKLEAGAGTLCNVQNFFTLSVEQSFALALCEGKYFLLHYIYLTNKVIIIKSQTNTLNIKL